MTLIHVSNTDEKDIQVTIHSLLHGHFKIKSRCLRVCFWLSFRCSYSSIISVSGQASGKEPAMKVFCTIAGYLGKADGVLVVTIRFKTVWLFIFKSVSSACQWNLGNISYINVCTLTYLMYYPHSVKGVVSVGTYWLFSLKDEISPCHFSTSLKQSKPVGFAFTRWKIDPIDHFFLVMFVSVWMYLNGYLFQTTP